MPANRRVPTARSGTTTRKRLPMRRMRPPRPRGEAVEPDGHEGDHDARGCAGESNVADHKHDEAEAVKLSQAAQENVGLRLAKVELRSFERTITVPAMVVERPGRSTVQVAAPLTGVVTRIWPLQGETVDAGPAAVRSAADARGGRRGPGAVPAHRRGTGRGAARDRPAGEGHRGWRDRGQDPPGAAVRAAEARRRFPSPAAGAAAARACRAPRSMRSWPSGRLSAK